MIRSIARNRGIRSGHLFRSGTMASMRLMKPSRCFLSSGKVDQEPVMDDDFKPRMKPPTSTGTVEDLIRQDISSSRVFLYMKGHPEAPQCGFSYQVVQILGAEGVTFQSRNVLDNHEIREGIKKFSDWPTIPQLFVDGEFVGGCDIVTQMFKSGELKQLLHAKTSE